VPIRAAEADHRIPESGWGEYLPKPMGHEIAGTVGEVGEGVETDDGATLLGDVEFDAAEAKAGAITPVPGGVGPMTRAMVL
jgi:5,10-methylene-tetrahydrofolate dehydrogenase/methenyl tetrahydrofolate cyclohydrolase